MNTNLLDIPLVRDYLSSRILCSVKTDEKCVALTFDDGPSERNTPALLGMLSGKRIRATFFVVGKRVHQYPDVFRQIVGAGHEVGNHTYSHIPLPAIAPSMIRSQFRRTNELILSNGGDKPRFMRPPMGWFNDRVLRISREMGMYPVIGSVYPRDSNRPGVDVILGRVLSRIASGAIIILHDGGWRRRTDRGQTLDAADRITDNLMEMGYKFRTIASLVDSVSVE